jgi:hypothetical protein
MPSDPPTADAEIEHRAALADRPGSAHDFPDGRRSLGSLLLELRRRRSGHENLKMRRWEWQPIIAALWQAACSTGDDVLPCTEDGCGDVEALHRASDCTEDGAAQCRAAGGGAGTDTFTQAHKSTAITIQPWA